MAQSSLVKKETLVTSSISETEYHIKQIEQVASKMKMANLQKDHFKLATFGGIRFPKSNLTTSTKIYSPVRENAGRLE